MSHQGTGRKAYMDVLKALGVMAIILAHSDPPPAVGAFVSTYYIAVFFFVSGYFYNEAYSDKLALLARKRLASLYVPFVTWNLAYLALNNAFFALNIYSSRAGYLDQVGAQISLGSMARTGLKIVGLSATVEMAGALWFLISLMTAIALFALASWTSRRIGWRPELVRATIVLILFALGYRNMPWLTWPAFINTSLVGVLLLYGGLLFRRFESRMPMNAIAAIGAATVVAFGSGTVNMGANQYAGPLVLVVVVAAGIYTNLFVAHRLNGSRFLNYLGRNTIFVVATHFLAFKVASLAYIQINESPAYMLAKFPVISGGEGWWIAYFACGLLLPMGAKRAYDWIAAHTGAQDPRTGIAMP